MKDIHTGAALDIHQLSVSFSMYDKGLRQRTLSVISDLNLHVRKGEIMAVIGSSGSGKSLLAHAVLGILPSNASVKGTITVDGALLTREKQAALRGKDMILVPQSVSYLDPTRKVGLQVCGPDGTREQQETWFRKLELPPGTGSLYPFQLSGGMARRVLIATALISSARLIIADEPTPGLSLDMAQKTMAWFRRMADEGRAVFIITHDMDLAFAFADRIAVFYAGTILEIGSASDFREGGAHLRHPYSRALWQALPQNGMNVTEGEQPYAGNSRQGCPYAARCPLCTKECLEGTIPMRSVRGGEVRCIHAN